MIMLIDLIIYFIAGLENYLSPADVSDVVSVLAITIPCIIVGFVCYMIVWAIQGVFNRR